jgi:hypothetical protein
VEVEDRLAPALTDIDDDPVVVQTSLTRGVGDEVEHALGLVRRKLAHLAEARHVPLWKNEQVGVGARVDVADRDEAVALGDVVALADQPAKEAVVRQRGSPRR